MAYTREFLRALAKESAIEMPKEMEDRLISEHITARDVYAEKAVKTELEKQPKPEQVNVTESEEYKKLQNEFDTLKNSIATEKTKAAKLAATKAYFMEKGIEEKNIDLAMRAASAEVDAAEMDGEKLKDTAPFDALISGALSPLVTTTHEDGAGTSTPPSNDNGPTDPMLAGFDEG